MNCGICIVSKNYNVFCYADDIMLTSLTSTGLQSLINTANKYISSHGLRFNLSKTTCTTFGTNHLTQLPTWHICHNILAETKQVTNLGTVLFNDVSPRIDAKIKATRGAFYGLQGAGLCKNGVNASTLRHIFNTALHPVLLFGCANLYIRKKHLLQLDKQMARLLTPAIGLPKWYKKYI